MILGTFITITEGMMTDMLGYVGDLFTDFAPFILIIVAVGLATIFVGGIINSIKR